MSDAATEPRRTDWTKGWPSFEIFRTFRMAIHPSKLGLALLGVALTGLWGTLLDSVWPQTRQPIAGELNAYWQTPDINAWRTAARQAQVSSLRAIYAEAGIATPPADLENAYINSPNRAVDAAATQLKSRYRELTANKDAEQTAQIARDYNGLYEGLDALRPQGIFTSLLAHEAAVGGQAIESAFSLNFMGRLNEVVNARHTPAPAPDAGFNTMGGVGVVPSLFLMLRGKQWLITEHFFYFLLLAAGALAIWALIGGAICRMAALNVAREERIAPRAGLQFAAQKYLSFLTAPLLPVALIVIIGICLLLGGVLMAIPYLGEIVGGLLLFLGLLGGFIIALVVVGGLVGSSLFYPTIAVEGSDSFDAMSRSYSYVYSRPWRTIWYCLLAFLYGSLCYLFVRFFALIMLKATRAFMDLGTGLTHRPGTGAPGATKLDAMWATPTFDSLRNAPPPFGMMHWEPAGAWLIGLWVLLVIALLAAFVVSFYFCASTIIYYLLRREVDATDLEEVYADEEEEESAAAETAGAAAPATPAVSSPPAEPPASEPPPPVEGQPTP